MTTIALPLLAAPNYLACTGGRDHADADEEHRGNYEDDSDQGVSCFELKSGQSAENSSNYKKQDRQD